VLFIGVIAGSQAVAAEMKRPNIEFVLADDKAVLDRSRARFARELSRFAEDSRRINIGCNYRRLRTIQWN
jgi:hypothetical protein